MTLRTAVAAPFVQKGCERMARSEFVVALSLDRDWFSPDQAKRLIDVAASEGLVTLTETEVAVAFDPDEVSVPDGFQPDESILQARSTFERVLEDIVDAGIDKREAVAAINRLQDELAVTIEAAAVVYAKRQGLDVTDHAERAAREC